MILIVGGAGYVGSQIVKEFVSCGKRVKVLDRGYFGFNALDEVKDKIELIVSDMRKVSPSVFENVRTIINVGGLSNDPTAEYSPEANMEMNVNATYKIAEDGKANGVGKYILASSCSIYDRGLDDERSDTVLDESAMVNPQAAYAVSKLKAEEKLFELADDNFKCIALRKGTIFGYSDRMRYDLVVNTFLKAGLKDGVLNLHNCGQVWRPMLAIEDAVQAYKLASDYDISTGVYNVTSFNIRVSEIAIVVQSVLRKHNYKCDFRLNTSKSGIRNYRVTSEKFRRLGWNPSVTLEKSVENMLIEILGNEKTDWDNPLYYNINWMKCIDMSAQILGTNKKAHECI